MKYERVKCWFVSASVFDIDEIRQQDHHMDLLKKSILKNGYRAYCINDRAEVEQAEWYRQYQLGEKPAFYIDGSGAYKLVNIDLTENELYFEKNDLPIGYEPWIFYGWQSDYNPSRTHIQNAIEAAIEDINENRAPKSPLELAAPSRPEDGSSDIVETIKRNIDKSLVAVFDITNVAAVVPSEKTDEDDDKATAKTYPNANVVFELSYALQRKRKDQIVLVRRKRGNDLPSDSTPFDFRQRNHLSYDKPAQLNSRINDVVTQTLTRMDFITPRT